MEPLHTQRTPLLGRVLAAFLCLSLCLPNSAHALRPQPDFSGLEEKLTAGLEEDKDKEIDQLIRLVSAIVPAGTAQQVVGQPGKHRLGQFLQREDARRLRAFIGRAKSSQDKKREREKDPDKEWLPLEEISIQETEEILAQLEKRANHVFTHQGPQVAEDLPYLPCLPSTRR